MHDPARTPVIVAVGQVTERDELVTNLDLAERAAAIALGASGALADRIERVTMVGALLAPAGPRPASELAERLRLKPSAVETTTTGGNTPQWLVTRAAEEIADGDLRATLIVGSEAARSHRAAGKGGPSPFNAPRADRNAPDADPIVGGSDEGFLSRVEVGAGLVMPTTVYPAIESVLASRAGRALPEHRAYLGTLMERFTAVAAANPYAWFRDAATADDLATPTDDNRVTSEPYTKRMNAFPFTDQAAALVVCSLEVASELGIDGDAVYIWSGANAADVKLPTARPDLGRSPGIEAAVGRAFEAAGIGIDDVTAIDLYSCFPSAVQIGAAAIGASIDDGRGFTVTGGLPYFGGPGNDYVTHSIASMVDTVRATAGLGLCTALGGYITKHAAGLYGATPPPNGFRRGDTSDDQARIDASAIELTNELDADRPTPATIEAYTIAYAPDGSGAVASTPVVATLDDGSGRRVAARADDAVLPDIDAAGEVLVGKRVMVSGSPVTWRW